MHARQRIRQSDNAVAPAVPTPETAPEARTGMKRASRFGLFRRVALVALLSLGAFGLARPADAAPGNHPYFDDQGTLVWYRSFDDAATAARLQNKVIFLEAGRRRCPQCRHLCRTLVPHNRIRSDISKVAVGLVADADRMPNWMRRLFGKNLSSPGALPLVAFIRPDKSWITGFWGRRSLSQFEGDVSRARATWQTMQPVRAIEPEAPRQADENACGTCKDGSCTPPDEIMNDLIDTPLGRGALLHPGEDEVAALGEDDVVPPTIADCDPLKADAVGSPDRMIDAGPEHRVIADGASSGTAKGTPDAAPLPITPTSPNTTEKITPVSALPEGLRARAEAARERGAWGHVLQLTDRVEGMEDLAKEARRWAADTLSLSVRLMRARSFSPARKSLEAVATEFDGFPAAIDAKRGLKALRVLEEMRWLEKDGAVSESLGRKAHEDMRGSRWATLFAAR